MGRQRLDAVVSGVGQSAVGRRLHRPALDLTVDACLEAIADAGLTTADIDGIATYPGAIDNPPGFSGGVGVTEVQEALRLELDWYTGGIEAPGQLGSVVNAAMAVTTGLARHVLCFRTVTEASAQGDSGTGGGDARSVGRRRRREWRRHPPRRVHAVGAAVRRPVGGELDRHDGHAPLPRVRDDARAAGRHRAQRSGQRRAQPEGDLPRPDDARRLPVGPDDLRAALPLRLRRTVRRFDGRRRLRRRDDR